MSQPPLTNRSQPEYKTGAPGSPVSGVFINVIKGLHRASSEMLLFVASNGSFFMLNTYIAFWVFQLCFLCGACEQPWSDKWFHPVTALYSDKGRRTQRRGCQGNMVIEGKRQMCAYTHSRAHTHSLTLCQWQPRLAWGYSICEDSGGVTVLSLEVMAGATCKAEDTDSGWRDMTHERHRHTKALTAAAHVQQPPTHTPCTRATCARSKFSFFFLLKWDS